MHKVLRIQNKISMNYNKLFFILINKFLLDKNLLIKIKNNLL